MSSNADDYKDGTKTEPSTDTTEQEHEEGTVSLDEVVAEEEALEADARAVLGGADDENCTYPKGYLTRQALYACGTCCPGELAGICYACSIHCHDGHTLFELYTKRKFRCDCGNSKFPQLNPCKLEKTKDTLNSQNRYNHNFRGQYCSCDRPYPDPEDSVDDEQIQCIVCEDWFHSRHLVNDRDSLPESDTYAEMVCMECTKNLTFLADYALILSKDHAGETERSSDIKLEKCQKPAETDSNPRSLFLPQNWREKLCRCEVCLSLYKSKECEFLVDPTDTVHHYESEGTSANRSGEGSILSAGISALNKLDRVSQVEMLHEYNNMKSGLSDYLKRFADSGTVVKESDIKDFFEGLKAQKRPRLELPDNCR